MLRLRPYRTKDSIEIATWCQDEKTFYEWNAGLMGDFPLTPERFDEAVSGRIDDDTYFPFVVFDDSGIVGFFQLRNPGEDTGELRFGFVIVSPKVRGKGYGKQMLQLGVKYAFELYGANKVSLGVFANNKGAYHCYKAVGFKEKGQCSEYELCGEIWKCIELELNQSFIL
ncbi:MAG: GNAT family N-acetyltransferase [Lachnospiraceae bacterium]